MRLTPPVTGSAYKRSAEPHATESQHAPQEAQVLYKLLAWQVVGMSLLHGLLGIKCEEPGDLILEMPCFFPFIFGKLLTIEICTCKILVQRQNLGTEG